MSPIFMSFERVNGGIVYININQIKTLAPRDAGTVIDFGYSVHEVVKGTPAETASDIARWIAEVSR